MNYCLCLIASTFQESRDFFCMQRAQIFKISDATMMLALYDKKKRQTSKYAFNFMVKLESTGEIFCSEHSGKYLKTFHGSEN